MTHHIKTSWHFSQELPHFSIFFHKNSWWHKTYCEKTPGKISIWNRNSLCSFWHIYTSRMPVNLELRLLPLKWRFLRHNDINRIETNWNGFLLSELLPHQISRQNIKKCGSYQEKCQPVGFFLTPFRWLIQIKTDKDRYRVHESIKKKDR